MYYHYFYSGKLYYLLYKWTYYSFFPKNISRFPLLGIMQYFNGVKIKQGN